MAKSYTTSTETAKYLDAVVLLHKGASLASEACEDIYGSLFDPEKHKIIEPFEAKLDEAIAELFKLIQANVEVNLGFLENVAKEEVTI